MSDAQQHNHDNSSSSSSINASETSSTLSNASTQQASSSSGSTTSGNSSSQQQDPVLHRLKELEESNLQNAKALERMKRDLADKDDKIKLLSADKRKEMESVLSTAIDNWLNSLSGVSEENRNNFRQGISKLAEQAEMNNAAWEIVCNASALHNTNVKRIEELLSEAKDRERELGELKGFRSEASRISSVKRARFDPPPGGSSATSSSLPESSQQPPPASSPQESSEHGSAWDTFQSMISRDFRSSYF